MSSPLLSSDNNYDVKTLLGSGSYGVVNKIVTKIDDPRLNKKAPQEYALKQIDLKKFTILIVMLSYKTFVNMRILIRKMIG